MGKTIFHRLFGIGRIPKRYRKLLEREGILLLDEGIGGTVTLRHFKAPGRRHSLKRSWFTGSLVLTEKTFAAFNLRHPLIYVPLSDRQHLAALDISTDDKGRLCIAYDASVFNDDWSGEVECRFNSALARPLLERLSQT